MQILFLHDNFPAQFGALGRHLISLGWDVIFGTQKQGVKVDGARVFTYTPHRNVTKDIHPYVAGYERAVINGQNAARACFELKRKGINPDIVMAHTGWGPGMFVKEVWPSARFIGYFEWYYNADAPDVAFLGDNGGDDEKLRARARNAAILSDLVACDGAICPTHFQKSQFPDLFHDKLTVMHDGIDTTTYAPNDGCQLQLPDLDLSSVDEVITYVARGMEPYRGFPQFMAALSKVQKQRPNVHAVIVGEDRVAYGKRLDDGDSYRKRALEQHDFDLERTHFTGLLSRPEFLKVLQVSSAHVYLTVPFVLSWSMMEAMSTGCLVLASDTLPVREVITPNENGLVVDFSDTDAIAEKMCDVLERQNALNGLRLKARKTIVENYDTAKIYQRKIEFLTSN